MEEYNENEKTEISNQEYKRRIKNIFNKMNDNRKLRFWYRYISKIEEG